VRLDCEKPPAPEISDSNQKPSIPAVPEPDPGTGKTTGGSAGEAGKLRRTPEELEITLFRVCVCLSFFLVNQ